MAGVKPEKLTVSTIKSRLLNVAQTSLYRLTLSIPPAVGASLNLTPADYENINLMCSEATLPGSSINTHEVTNDYHGVTEKMGYRRMYDETIGLTFYVDRNYKVIELLEGWMDYITGIDNKNEFKSPYKNYRMSYPTTYKRDIYLTKFEKDQFTRDFSVTRGGSKTTSRSTLDYTFIRAFPLSLTAIPVSYEASDVLKCNVSFNFIRYIMEPNTSLVTTQGILNRRDLGMNDQLRSIQSGFA
tara:strand:+ start:35 stop:760 length:726 start_codon:yes stop_codon:yes gene_type:complete